MAYKNKKKSPAKFITALFGGAALRQEQDAAQEDFGNQTVNLKQAEFEKEQSQQSMANIMTSMQGSAGGSGIAGLAQVLANQGVKQAQQSSLSIGAQEQANQQKTVAESGRLQELKVKGEQKRDMLEREGDRMVEQYDMDKQGKMLDIAGQRQDAANQSIDQMNSQIDAFATGALKAGVGLASGGLSTMAERGIGLKS